MKLELRDYQVEALARSTAAEARGVRRQLWVAATGLGKTVMFCAKAEQEGGRTLVLAHRDELISQAAAKVREVWPGVDVGIVKAEQNDVRSQVVVASVQTLARESRLAKLVQPFDPNWPTLLGRAAPFDLVIIDEAHHAAADSYRAIIEALRAGEKCEPCGGTGTVWQNHGPGLDKPIGCEACQGQGDGPLLVGVTATPDRGDGKGLDDLFDEIVSNYDILWGIRAGYLSDLRGIKIEVDSLDLSEVKVRRGDYDQGQAGRAMEDAEAERYVVSAWMEHALGRRTLVFTPTVETARLVAAEFVRCGVSAAYVHGGTPLEERRQILRDYSTGAITVLANCAVLTEGYDEPRTDCIVIARPTKSRALYTQMVGRGTRRHPDKTDCLVLDIVGNSDTLSLVTIPSLFGLPQDYAERVETEGVAEVMQAWDDDLVRIGKMRSEDANLFRRIREEGMAWVAIHTEAEVLRRYVLSLGQDRDSGEQRPTLVLAQRVPGEDIWTCGLQEASGQKKVLMADVSMELAQGVGEDYVRKHGGAAKALTDSKAAWRQKPMSPKARTYATRGLKITVDPTWNAGQLSDAINQAKARKEIRP